MTVYPFFLNKKKGLTCVVTDPTHWNPNSTRHGVPLGMLGLFTSQHNIYSLKRMTQTNTPCKHHVTPVWDSYQCTMLPNGITTVYPCSTCIGHTKYQYENSIYNLKHQYKAFFFFFFFGLLISKKKNKHISMQSQDSTYLTLILC